MADWPNEVLLKDWETIKGLRAEVERLRDALVDLREYFETGKIHSARVDANKAEQIIDAALADQGKG